jgi:hypothetical protein
MLRSDEVFLILFVHILLVKKILSLLFDSSSYIERQHWAGCCGSTSVEVLSFSFSWAASYLRRWGSSVSVVTGLWVG